MSTRSRRWRISLPSSLLLLGVAVAPAMGQANGQGTRQSARESARAAGPSMAETKGWIESDMASLTTLFYSERAADTTNHYRGYTQELAHDFVLDNCTLFYVTERIYRGETGSIYATKPDTLRTSVALPLRAVDVEAVQTEQFFGPRPLMSRVPTYVLVPKSASSGAHIRQEWGLVRSDTASSVRIPVGNEHAGARVVRALRRAAVLCGAPESPF